MSLEKQVHLITKRVALEDTLDQWLIPKCLFCIMMSSYFLISMFKKEAEGALKGFRNGLEYGSKVRFVHTLVMTLLFKDIRLKQFPTLMKTIVSMAVQHGFNLGLFVFAYKSCYKALNSIRGPSSLHHFISGLLFGTLIFGKKTGVNNQIVLYLLSRVMIGVASLAYKWLSKKLEGGSSFVDKGYTYYLLAAVCWGTVMWLFELDKSLLQASLSHSMEFLYKESDTVKKWTELIPYYPKDQSKRRLSKQIISQPTRTT